MDNIIGIDVSKDTLDVHRLTDGRHNNFTNDKTGHTQLLKWISLPPDTLIVFEATGAYHRRLEQFLSAKTIAFVKVNPKQARRFAQACGRLAKKERTSHCIAKGWNFPLKQYPFTRTAGGLLIAPR